MARGRAHSHTQSVATRISSVELEADALCTEILNVHELRHEPLRSARSDVRLCQSLNQIWRDENARRAAIGLGRLEDQATGATPHSAAAKRNVLPPLPRRLNAELKAIDNLLARPPVAQTPLPPSQGESSQQSQDLLCQPASQNSEEMAAAAAAAAESQGEGGLSELLALHAAAGGTPLPESQQSHDSELQGLVGGGGGAGASFSQLSEDGASLAGQMDNLRRVSDASSASRRLSTNSVLSNNPEVDAAMLDEEVYLSGGASQGLFDADDHDASSPGGGASPGGAAQDLLDDANAQYPFFGESDIPHANGLDSEIIEIEVDRIKQLASGQERQQEAERIELAVRAQVAGVSTVSVSEQTGTVLVEASAMPWLRAGEEDDEEWVGRLEAAVLSAIRSVNHIGRSTSARNVDIEAEVAASQMEMREVMQHQQPQPRTHDWDWASVLQKPAAGGDGGEAAEAMEAEEEDEGSWQQHDQAGSPKDGEGFFAEAPEDDDNAFSSFPADDWGDGEGAYYGGYGFGEGDEDDEDEEEGGGGAGWSIPQYDGSGDAADEDEQMLYGSGASASWAGCLRCLPA